MPSSTLNNVLITANVLQNLLAQNPESCLLYVDLLRRLAEQSISLYISALDWDLAVGLPHIYRIRGDRHCQVAYNAIQQVVKICHVDESILEDAREFRMINRYDAIRLACASSHNVEAIVTWEPYQFVRTNNEYWSLRKNQYFDINLHSVLANDMSLACQSIRVLSVNMFLLMESDLGESSQLLEPEENTMFCLEDLKFWQQDDLYHAEVTIGRYGSNYVQETAVGTTPVDAIYRAIDQCIDHYTQLPTRYLLRFSVPDTYGGAGADTTVDIRVRCGNEVFRAIASDTSLLRAFADAYITALNEIWACPSFS